MSKLADALRAIRVHNNYEILERFGEPGCMAIEYQVPMPRSCEARRTSVWSPYPASWLKRSGISRAHSHSFIGSKKETYWLARNWACERTGHDYVPSPFGGLIPQHVRHKAERAAFAPAVRADTENAGTGQS